MTRKNNNLNNNLHHLDFPFRKEIQNLKKEVISSINEMPDEEFMLFLAALLSVYEGIGDELDIDEYVDDWNHDEEWEDEAKKFYNQEKKKNSKSSKNKKNNYSNFKIDEDDLPF